MILPAVGWLIPAAFARSAREAHPIFCSKEITVRWLVLRKLAGKAGVFTPSISLLGQRIM